jgi:DNA helicase II / ATP-dependent DNA helicase PcrA
MQFSAQQQAAITWGETGEGSAIVESVAGSGKTTLLVAMVKKMKGRKAMVVYNKKNAEEFTVKVAGIPDVETGTVHSFGMKACRRAFGQSIKVDAYKVQNIVEHPQTDVDARLWNYRNAIVKLVSFAKQRALGVMGSIDDAHAWSDIITHFDVLASVELDKDGDGFSKPHPENLIIQTAIKVLKISNRLTAIIDFDDMVYLPPLLGLPMFRFDVVMIDEAQDTNPARRALVRSMVKKGGRVVAVGDRHQAIYGFTGADNDSLDQIERDFSAVRMPLTVSYRCPKAVIKFAQQWVSHISSAEGAIEGAIENMDLKTMMTRKDLKGNSAVLCRVTAPLVKLAFNCIRAKIACKIEGRDIGAGLKKLAQKWKVKTTDKLIVKLDEYQDRETSKALAKKNESKAQQIEDTVDTLKVIIENCNAEGNHTVDAVVKAIDSLFADDINKLGILTLSTIHKSKGREWERVYWFNRAETCPSKYARQKWQKDQEINLMYVAATRAKHTLIDLVG